MKKTNVGRWKRELSETTALGLLNQTPFHFGAKGYICYKSKDFHKEAASITIFIIITSCWDTCNSLLIGLPASCLLLLRPQLHIATRLSFLQEQIWPSHIPL